MQFIASITGSNTISRYSFIRSFNISITSVHYRVEYSHALDVTYLDLCDSTSLLISVHIVVIRLIRLLRMVLVSRSLMLAIFPCITLIMGSTQDFSISSSFSHVLNPICSFFIEFTIEFRHQVTHWIFLQRTAHHI